MALEEMNRCGTVWPLRCNLRPCSVVRRYSRHSRTPQTVVRARTCTVLTRTRPKMCKYANNTRIRRSSQQQLLVAGGGHSTPWPWHCVVRLRVRDQSAKTARSDLFCQRGVFIHFYFFCFPNPTRRVCKLDAMRITKTSSRNRDAR